MKLVHGIRSIGLAVTLGLLACSPSAPDEIVWERVIGTILRGSLPVVIQLPDTVSRGVSFPVSVRTYAGGCSAKGELQVSASDLTAELIPYDTVATYMPPDASPCLAILHLYDHGGMLRFDRPGSARVVIRGAAYPSDTLIEIVRSVVVR